MTEQSELTNLLWILSQIPCSPYSCQPSIQLSFSCCHVTPCHFFECPKPGSHHTATIICGTRLAVAIVSDPTWGQQHEVKNITKKKNMTLPSKSWQSSLFSFSDKIWPFCGSFFLELHLLIHRCTLIR